MIASPIRSSRWLVGGVAGFCIFALWQFGGVVSSEPNTEDRSPSRVSDYPETFISSIDVDLASPNHWVSLTWVGPAAGNQRRGPFRSCPGVGLGSNNCNDFKESNRVGSNCTPKGKFTVQGVSDSLATSDISTHVTWIDMSREIAFHGYPYLPDFPASHGCIRLDPEEARLIHDNVVVGKTTVAIEGVWSRPVDLVGIQRQLIEHEGKRWSVYVDSQGHPTIGVGFNLQRAGAKQSIESVGADYEHVLSGKDRLNDHQIEQLFKRDISDSIRYCREVLPNFGELSSTRQRVVVDMMFNLGKAKFATFKKFIHAVRNAEYEKAAKEMEDSKWHGQVKTRAVKLTEMMRLGTDQGGRHGADEIPVIDSNMTREEAMKGVARECPDSLEEQIDLVDVIYYSFDGKLHRGQLLIHRDLRGEVDLLFRVMREHRFPIGSVIPLSAPQFVENGSWSDDLSMKANNTSAFNYRNIQNTDVTSFHGLGRAIDINPMQNPSIADGLVSPLGATYELSSPGTLSAGHPVVNAFLELGWQWGGFWRRPKDYQHFEKPPLDVAGGELGRSVDLNK